MFADTNTKLQTVGKIAARKQRAVLAQSNYTYPEWLFCTSNIVVPDKEAFCNDLRCAQYLAQHTLHYVYQAKSDTLLHFVFPASNLRLHHHKRL